MKYIKTAHLLFLSALTALAIGCGSEEKDKSNQLVIPVKVEVVKKSEVVMPIRTSGRIESASEMNLSFKIPGIINSIKVTEGEYVKKGELLAALDLSEISANLNKAEQGFKKAERDYKRTENLYNDKVVTLEQLQNAKTLYEIAESDLKIAEFNFEHSIIKAPDSGKILRKFAEENELVNSGHPVLTFGSSKGNWKLKVGVADIDVVNISVKDSAAVKLDSFPSREFSGYVVSIGEASDPRTGTYEVEIILDKSRFNIKSGFIGTAEIFPTKNIEYVLTPVNAIVEANLNSGFVYIPKQNNRVEKVKVGIAGFYRNMAAVSSGLEDGTKIITSGAEYLNERSVIKIIN